MDAYLAADAARALEALALVVRKTRAAGLVLGHRRGHRFFIEGVVPLPSSFPFSLEDFDHLDTLYHGRIIGFFSSATDKRQTRRILRPYAAGRLLLECRIRPRGRLGLNAYLIDYDGRFVLAPLIFHGEKRGPHERSSR